MLPTKHILFCMHVNHDLREEEHRVIFNAFWPIKLFDGEYPCMNFTFKKTVVLIRIVMLCSGKLESGKIVRSLNAVHVLNNKLVTY